MALANDDIWQKFDLFSDQKLAKRVEIELIDTIPEFTGDYMPESNNVPDISDFLFDLGQNDSFENIDFSNDSLLNSADERFNLTPQCGRVLDLSFIDLESLESSETLRHDCMWSGLCPSEEHKHQKHRKDHENKVIQAHGNKNGVEPQHAKLSVFDTPIQSDLDNSDLDETFSESGEIDVENVAALDKLVIPTSEKLKTSLPDVVEKASDHTYTDHCYISPSNKAREDNVSTVLSLLTPAQSSEDEDIQNTTVKDCSVVQSTPPSLFKQGNRNKKGKDLMNTIKTRPPRVLHITDKLFQTDAKFKFQMKFTSDGSSPKSRSLLRHPSRLNRTHYTKRKTAVKNSFCPSTMKQIQIQQTGVVQMQGNRTKDGKSHKHRDKGDKCRDVRDLHNSMERQRRVDLKNAFDGLKICVPEIADSDRASKLMILDKAADFCQSLKRKEASLNSEKEKEKRKNILLRNKMSMLQTHSNKSLQKRTRKVFL